MKKYAPGVPIILCGTKYDLREDRNTIEELKEKNLTPVTFSQGKDLMKEIGAIDYLGKLVFEYFNAISKFNNMSFFYFT